MQGTRLKRPKRNRRSRLESNGENNPASKESKKMATLAKYKGAQRMVLSDQSSMG